MRQTLQSRLQTLEARSPIAQTTPPTDKDRLRWCYGAFRFNELAISNGVVVVNHRTARPNEHAALEIMASAINRWRADSHNEPFLPIMLDDAKRALELLRAGHLLVSKDGQRISQNYKFSWEYNHEHANIGEILEKALRTFVASGGGDGHPYQDGEVVELLAAFVEHAEVNG